MYLCIMKDIKLFEGLYQISENGIVVALERKVAMPNGGVKIIKQHHPKLSETYKGYLKVMLTSSEGIRKGFFVHRLVIATYLHESNLQVNHKDSNKKNNNISNLEYVTNRQNQIHRIDKTKTSSKYVGVTKKGSRWQCQKMVNGKHLYLGMFDNELDAKRKYDLS